MQKDCLGFHQFETIALMPCFSMNMNLFLEECGVFCGVFFINVTNKILNILTVARMTRMALMTRMARPLARMARWLADL